MKYYIRISFILCAALCSPSIIVAQNINGDKADSTMVGDQTETFTQNTFRKVAQNDLPDGVSVVNMTSLLEKNYTTYSLDNMEGLIGGWTGNSMWGMDEYLVLVDGVPRDANNVMPTEIEQITFLKSAASVLLYGSRAAKGVVYITTKRGKAEPLGVNVRANTGFHVSKRYPKYLGSAEYMTLYNEARINDGQAVQYNDDDIYHYASGSNPYRYPDVDFYASEYLKKAYNRTDVTAELTGGNERSRFYTNIGYQRQGDVFNFGEVKNNYTDRFNVRGNIDLNITQKITAFVNANATFYNARSGNTADSDPNNTDNYWTYAATMRPNRVAPLIPLEYIDPNALSALEIVKGGSNIIDGKYFLGGSQTDLQNVFADYYAAGSSKWTSRQFQFDAGLNFDLSSVTKGLTFHTQYAVDYATSYTSSYNNSYAVYEPAWYNYNGPDVIAGLTKYNNDKKSGVQNITGSSNRQTIAFTSYFNYVSPLQGGHNMAVRLLATGFQQTRSQVYHRIGNANLGLEVNYNYHEKYYVSAATALVRSAKLAAGHRNGLSSSATLGWNLSKESFLANSSAVNGLTIDVSGSILKTDLDIDEYNLSEENFTQANGAWWGWYDGAAERSTNSLRGSNENLDFVNRKEIAANIRTSLWNDLITANASFFINTMEGLIIQPSTLYPSYFGTGFPNSSFMPFVNYNNHQRKGIDFAVNVNKQIGEVGFSWGLVGMYYKSEATRIDENFEDAYRNRTGKPLDGIWGLQSAGLFQDQAEIDNSPQQKFGGTIRPGDIKYVDQNNDNKIDERDEIFLGRAGWNGAPFTGGVNVTAQWKGFTLFALGTGNFGAYALKNNSYFWVYGNRKYSEVVRGRWTEDTKETATYPRLTSENGINNFRSSDFWLYKTNRFNLARIQLTYAVPGRILKNSFARDISVYISGANLLTLSKEREILEMNITSAPQTRFYNVGVRAAF
ncbi:SusC/RagA family TonB-linked outer membrane protein [Fulvivirgaceae bacterium PWU4]|uniref:SusC/RagA family TonB-linked outer membrane protein n=1 Tax=Chryseosolibacter histidini TaxID=2782349 RepID=A0AAP2DFN2_9BACT|nr:SusC/RagA family TonB-linked outer membrane protein [Chryseosolibacter histidini]MBT1695536.1 SusC/RagA family TonB-linked outer membrane protein [Chryseosolibacter histidini]